MDSLQLLSCYKTKFDISKFCKRIKIDTGYKCNLRCEFCYNGDNHNLPNRSFDEIKNDIIYYSTLGFKSFDFSGGEPSIIKDLPKYIAFAKRYGDVSCVSNGFGFAKMSFLKECHANGLNEILFSLHSIDEKRYRMITNGDLKYLLTAISNAKKLGMIIRLNITVYSKTDLSDFSVYINELHPYQVNFILLNYFEGAQNFIHQDVYNDCQKIKCCIDQINDDIDINVRYAPFCYMQGYEKYVKDYFQHLYDKHDWSLLSYYPFKDIETESQADEMCIKIARQHRCDSFVKKPQCKNCKYFFECDGVKFRELEVFPIVRLK